jgi:hypothetical protein
MSSVILIPPKLTKPGMLEALSASMVGMGSSEGATLRKFPLMNMEGIFVAYSEGRESQISTIDHFRLAMALIVNLHTITEGKEERYSSLCHRYLPDNRFAEAVFRKSLKKNVFLLYLQKIFLRFETVKRPHLEFMEEFYLHALDVGNLPEEIDALIKIKENKTSFLKGLSKRCLESGRSIAVVWDSLELIEDDYVREHYLTPAEDFLLDELIRPETKIETKRVSKFLLLLLDFSIGKKTLVKRLEKCIFAAEKNELLQQPLLELVERNLKTPPNWDLAPGISKTAIKAYERLCGLVEFQYFERIAEIVYEMFLSDHDDDERRERERLRSRTFFWMNYREQIDHIKVFMNAEKHRQTMGNFLAYQSKFNISERLMANVGTTPIDAEIVFVLIGQFLVIECFRGASKKALLIPNGIDIFESVVKEKQLRADDLAYFESRAQYSINHIMLWQKALMNFLSDRFRFQPKGTQILYPVKGEGFYAHRKKNKSVYMNKTEKIVFEHFKDHNDLVEKVVEGKETRVSSNVIVRRKV